MSERFFLFLLMFSLQREFIGFWILGVIGSFCSDCLMYDYTEPHLLGDFLRCSLVIKGLISLKKVVSQDDLCFLSDEIQCPLEVAMQGQLGTRDHVCRYNRKNIWNEINMPDKATRTSN